MIASGTLSVAVVFGTIADVFGTTVMQFYMNRDIILGYDVFSAIWGMCIILLGVVLIQKPVWAWEKAIMILVPYLGFWIVIMAVSPIVFFFLKGFLSLREILLYVVAPSLNLIVLAYLIIGRKYYLEKQDIQSE